MRSHYLQRHLSQGHQDSKSCLTLCAAKQANPPANTTPPAEATTGSATVAPSQPAIPGATAVAVGFPKSFTTQTTS
jgi:hypothetical protein